MNLALGEAVALGLAALSFLIWFYLILFHGRFWLADQRLVTAEPHLENWPSITAVIPARNEEAYIGRAVSSLLSQNYPGRLSVLVVDDGSSDGTASSARTTGADAGIPDRLSVLTNPPLPDGWAGKMWALHNGIETISDDIDFLLLTDADIEHGPGTLKRLAVKAETAQMDLVSLMVKLHCKGFWERLLVPAFVFFFQKLYPFPRVNDPDSKTAGAAGGCMLVRQSALKKAGGIAAIRDRLIDDCALAERIKANGIIWLGLADTSRSLRPYDGLSGIWSMVARTAYTQLRYNPFLLLGACLGMVLIYIVPPLALICSIFAAFFGGFFMSPLSDFPILALLGGFAYALMLLAYFPTQHLYRPIGITFIFLPVAALLYTAMTLSSAWRHARGRGGGWKGRTYPSNR